MQPGVDVGFAAEVGDHVGALDLPDIPHFVIADVLVFVESEVEIVDAAGFDMFQGLRRVLLAEGGEEVSENFADVVLLVAGEVSDPDAVQPFFLPVSSMVLFPRSPRLFPRRATLRCLPSSIW